jgi:hypothetical protein
LERVALRLLNDEPAPPKELPASEDYLNALKNILHVYRRMRSLTGEMIATFFVPGNQEFFDGMPDRWHEIVSVWRENYEDMRMHLVELGELQE